MAKTFQSVPNYAHAVYYAKIVREKATFRALIDASTDILRDAYDESSESKHLLSQAEQKIFGILDGRGTSAVSPIARLPSGKRPIIRIWNPMILPRIFGGDASRISTVCVTAKIRLTSPNPAIARNPMTIVPVNENPMLPIDWIIAALIKSRPGFLIRRPLNVSTEVKP